MGCAWAKCSLSAEVVRQAYRMPSTSSGRCVMVVCWRAGPAVPGGVWEVGGREESEVPLVLAAIAAMNPVPGMNGWM
jgi:hypothetical protein